MIQNEPGAWALLRQDIRRTYEMYAGSTLGRAVDCLRTPGIYAIATYRLGHWLSRRRRITNYLLKPLYIVLDRRMRAKWGIQIQEGAQFAGGFHIHHFGGIFVSGYSVVGENFTLSHDVTLGASGEGAKRGAPTIGDNVYVAPGAKLFGRIRIGNNVKIAPNSVVDKNVPDNAMVHPAPIQVISMAALYASPPKPD